MIALADRAMHEPCLAAPLMAHGVLLPLLHKIARLARGGVVPSIMQVGRLWLGQLHWAPAGVQGCNCAGGMPRGTSAEPCSEPQASLGFRSMTTVVPPSFPTHVPPAGPAVPVHGAQPDDFP